MGTMLLSRSAVSCHSRSCSIKHLRLCSNASISSHSVAMPAIQHQFLSRPSRRVTITRAQLGGPGKSGKSFWDDLVKKAEDLVFNLTQRAKGKDGKSSLDAWKNRTQEAGGGGPPKDRPGWMGGGGGDGDDGTNPIVRFLKEWLSYLGTIIIFGFAWAFCWPFSQWCNKIQEMPASILNDIQSLFNRIGDFIQWVIGWKGKKEMVQVDEHGVEWVKGAMFMIQDAPIDPSVTGYEVVAPHVFDQFRYPNMTPEEKFALINYYALRPWERTDQFEVDPQWISAIKAKYEPNEADRQLWKQMKAEGREDEYWANRRPKYLGVVNGEWKTVSEGESEYVPDWPGRKPTGKS